MTHFLARSFAYAHLQAVDQRYERFLAENHGLVDSMGPKEKAKLLARWLRDEERERRREFFRSRDAVEGELAGGLRPPDPPPQVSCESVCDIHHSRHNAISVYLDVLLYGLRVWEVTRVRVFDVSEPVEQVIDGQRTFLAHLALTVYARHRISGQEVKKYIYWG